MTAIEVAARPRGAAPLLRAIRPRQWIKNLLVAAAPLAAGAIAEPDVASTTLVAVVAFCCASSAIYLFNDCVDVKSDRQHPLKRHRPIAAGDLSVRTAYGAAAALAVLALALASTTGTALVVLLVVYLVLQVAYALVLKHEPVLDIAVVASGFLLRAVAGGVAADLLISEWFLLVAGFGSLFIVAGKRYSELKTLGRDLGTRRSLVRYTESYLRFIWGVAAGLTIMAYSLWAFSEPRVGVVPWHALSVAPFMLGFMRYAVDVDAGQAAEPEDIIWRDRTLQVIGAVWLAVLTLGVTGG